MLAWDTRGGYMPVACEACDDWAPREAADDDEINGFVPDALTARLCRPCAIWCWGCRLLEQRPQLVAEPDPDRTLTNRELSGLIFGSWVLTRRMPGQGVVH